MIESILLAALLSAVPPPARIEPCKLGDIYQSRDVACTLTIANTGDRAVHVHSPLALGGDKIEPSELTVAPHASASFTAKLDFLSEAGETTHFFSFSADADAPTQITTSASTFVNSVLDEPKPKIDFGVVDLSGKMPTQKVTLSSLESPNFRVTKVVESPDYLNVVLDKDGRTLLATLKPNVSWGTHKDGFVVEMNSPRQKHVRVGVEVDAHGAVVPSSNPFALGMLRQGNTNEAIIVLTQQAGRDFKVGKLSLSGIDGQAEFAPCTPAKVGCGLVKFKIAPETPLGLVRGQILVELPEYHQTLPIAIWGLYVAKDTVVHDLNKEMAAREEGKSTDLKSPVNLSAALNEAVARAPANPVTPALPEGSGPLLKWRTSNQGRVHAYVIYRSDEENGQYVRVNADPILVHDAGLSAVDYAWRDSSAEHGKTYWYYIGLVNKDGSKQQLSGPQKVVAK